jgi:hypothetical protein
MDVYSSPCPSPPGKRKKHHQQPGVITSPAAAVGASEVLELPALTATEVRTAIVY